MDRKKFIKNASLAVLGSGALLSGCAPKKKKP